MKRKLFKQGNLVSLAVFELEDAEQLSEWVNQEEIRHFLSRYLPMHTEQETEWIKKLPSLQPNDIVLAIVKNDNDRTLIGSIGLHRISYKDRRAHGGIFIGSEKERRGGAGSEAARLMLDYAFNSLNLRKIVHEVFATNAASIALAKKLGGTHEGTLKELFSSEVTTSIYWFTPISTGLECGNVALYPWRVVWKPSLPDGFFCL